MRFLLDTHAFLWFIQGNDNISDVAKSSVEDSTHEKFISIASLWEIAIKVSIGKLAVEMPMTELVETQVLGNAFGILGILPEHLEELSKLPFHHKDPFDRLIIAQGLAEDMSVISKDKAFRAYTVRLVW